MGRLSWNIRMGYNVITSVLIKENSDNSHREERQCDCRSRDWSSHKSRKASCHQKLRGKEQIFPRAPKRSAILHLDFSPLILISALQNTGRINFCYFKIPNLGEFVIVVAGPKRKWRSVVGVSGGESKVQCCKEHCCIGTWNVRSMNQAKLGVVKQEMVRVNIDILRNQWTKMDMNGQI